MKTTITYRDSEPPVTVWRGHTFIKGKPVELDPDVPADAELLEAAKGNPSFDIGDESKADIRAEVARKKALEDAEGEIKMIDSLVEEMNARQESESHEVEARHSHEREEFMNRNEGRRIELLRVLRGSDGSDDLHPVEPLEPLPESEPTDQPVADLAGAPDHPYPDAEARAG